MLQSASRRCLSAAILGSFLSASVLAAQNLEVNESVTLAASPAVVWKVVGNFGDLAAWHPVVAKTEITHGVNNRRGAVRSIETTDGAKIVEELLGYQAGKMSLRYKFIESPLPVSDYRSNLSVVPFGKGSRVIWKGSFTANGIEDAKARELVIGIYREGFAGLRKRFGE